MGSTVTQFCSLTQSLATHECHIDSGMQSHQRLIGADVRRSLLSADMLFASLQGEHEGTLTTIVNGLAHNASWHLANQLLRTAHIAYIGTTIRHGNAQRLTIAYCNVGTPLARSLQHSQVGSNTIHDEQRLLLMASLSKTSVVLYNTIDIRLLNDNASHSTFCKLLLDIVQGCNTIANGQNLQLNALMQGIGLQHFKGLWIHGSSNQHLVLLLTSSYSHHHSLCSSRSTIIHGGIGNVHAREFCHHRLILENVMQGALRNLCLIGRIAGQELRARQQTGNGRRGVMVVDTHTCKAGQLAILRA